MTTPSAQRWPESLPARPFTTPPRTPPAALPTTPVPGLPLVRTYLRPTRPQLVDRAAHAWWLSIAAWFLGSAAGQFMHSPAALAFVYHYPALAGDPGSVSYQRFDAWSLPGPLAVVVLGVVAVFLASLVLPMRDGEQWARLALTVLAVPAELLLLRQIGESLFTGPVSGGGVVQGVLSLVGLCAIPGAVSMMYRPATRDHFHTDRPVHTSAGPRTG
jgi:hypothetical protein